MHGNSLPSVFRPLVLNPETATFMEQLGGMGFEPLPSPNIRLVTPKELSHVPPAVKSRAIEDMERLAQSLTANDPLNVGIDAAELFFNRRGSDFVSLKLLPNDHLTNERQKLKRTLEDHGANTRQYVFRSFQFMVHLAKYPKKGVQLTEGDIYRHINFLRPLGVELGSPQYDY